MPDPNIFPKYNNYDFFLLTVTNFLEVINIFSNVLGGYDSKRKKFNWCETGRATLIKRYTETFINAI